MLKVKNNGTVSMSRGDTVYLNVEILDAEGEPYTLKEGDKLYFAAKKKATDRDYAIPPKLLNGTLLELTSSDTYDLDFGSYLYDIQLRTADGRSNTIIKPSPLIIEETVTAYGDR